MSEHVQKFNDLSIVQQVRWIRDQYVKRNLDCFGPGTPCQTRFLRPETLELMRRLTIADFVSALDKVAAVASADESPEGQKLAFAELCAVIGSGARANDTLHGMRTNIEYMYHHAADPSSKPNE